MGPAQFQMADILILGSPEEQRDTTLDETTTTFNRTSCVNFPGHATSTGHRENS